MLLNENEKMRLMRLMPGADVDAVLEEFFSMAGDKQRQEFPSGIDVTTRDPLVPPIVMDFSPDDAARPFMRFNRGGFSFDLKLNADNSLSFGGEVMTGPNKAGGGGGGGAAAGGGGFPGQIISYGGGNVYSVRIYPSGLSAPALTVNVTQLEGDPAFPHADGRWAIVVLAGTSYYMNLPIWG